MTPVPAHVHPTVTRGIKPCLPLQLPPQDTLPGRGCWESWLKYEESVGVAVQSGAPVQTAERLPGVHLFLRSPSSKVIRCHWPWTSGWSWSCLPFTTYGSSFSEPTGTVKAQRTCTASICRWL